MDAEAMVKEAERWKQVPLQHVCVESVDRQIRYNTHTHMYEPPRIRHKSVLSTHQKYVDTQTFRHHVIVTHLAPKNSGIGVLLRRQPPSLLGSLSTTV